MIEYKTWLKQSLHHYKLFVIVIFVCYSWTGLVGKNYEIERACLELEQEVERLRQEQIIKHAKEEYKTQQMLQHPQEEDEEERVKAEEEEEEEEEEDSDESGEEGGDDVERYRVGSHSSSEEEGDR